MFKQQTPDPRPAQYQVALRSGGAGAPFSAVAKGREVNSRLTANSDITKTSLRDSRFSVFVQGSCYPMCPSSAALRSCTWGIRR